jgi:hypothetical protein
MQTLYHSDAFIVVEFDEPVTGRGGFEIVDKFARKETYIEGPLAERFKTGVQALADRDPSFEDFDDFIGAYSGALAQQPLVAH